MLSCRKSIWCYLAFALSIFLLLPLLSWFLIFAFALWIIGTCTLHWASPEESCGGGNESCMLPVTTLRPSWGSWRLQGCVPLEGGEWNDRAAHSWDLWIFMCCESFLGFIRLLSNVFDFFFLSHFLTCVLCLSRFSSPLILWSRTFIIYTGCFSFTFIYVADILCYPKHTKAEGESVHFITVCSLRQLILFSALAVEQDTGFKHHALWSLQINCIVFHSRDI